MRLKLNKICKFDWRVRALVGAALGVFLVQSAPISAQAQGVGLPSCALAQEAIVNLRDPVFGVPAIWDALFGD